MSDNGSNASRRSSSQASRASNDSKKTRTIRGQPKRAGSMTSNASLADHDPSLTSFPSLDTEHESPAEIDPRQLIAQATITRTTSQKARDRRATLAGLTNASPSVTRGNALFDDSPRSSLDTPGSLHLSSDEHIQRLIAKGGAVKLIRQYAQDLAQRDAEISALRIRADNRERELKRLLREADVPTAEIEKRLLRLEQGAHDAHADASGRQKSLGGLLDDAMATTMSVSVSSPTNEIGMPVPILQQVPTTRRSPAKASATSSQQSSRANSTLSQTSDPDQTLRPKAASGPGRVAGLQSMFQPPQQTSSYFIGGSKSVKKPKAADEVSVRSTQSSRSWTQIFGGKGTGRARASSLVEETNGQPSKAESALAKLSKTVTNPQPAPHRGSTGGLPSGTLKGRPAGRRTTTASRLSASPNHNRKDSNASLPLTVEMDSVVEPAELPPTMTHNNHDTSGVLMDRFGFIYDQRRRKRQSLQLPKRRKNQLSAEASSIRSDVSPPGSDPVRSATPLSINEDDSKKSWQEYLKPAYYQSRPKELLLHTPSAGAVVTVSTVGAAGTLTPPRIHSAEGGLVPTRSTSQPQSSHVNASTEGHTTEEEAEQSHGHTHDSTPTKLLLDQLNDLHDSMQTERMTKWNSFLRAVRAERASNYTTENASSLKNAPEADLLDGELIGIATLGRSAKQRAKYTHFKSLVLAGIPITLRPKIWPNARITADIRRTLTDNIFFQSGPGVKRLDEVLRAYSLHNPSIGYCQGMNLIAGSLLLICANAEDCFWLLVAVIDTILPSAYFSGSLLVARADQIVLREYVKELLPTLSAKLDELGVELEACTFHWFLSLYAGVLTGGEALYRIWDIVLTLHSTEAMPTFNETNRTTLTNTLTVDFPSLPNPLNNALNSISAPTTPVTASNPAATEPPTTPSTVVGGVEAHDGTSSPFLFQIALSLLYLNQSEILSLETPAEVYSYLNHNVTDHAVSVDALVQASEALGKKVKRGDVLEKRRAAVKVLGG
ncbi:TBC domain-containing protein C4G8.04 [Cyphellophora attinorum]|uniref:TBC domain-containing protein C4G8.04 n=1 Tax=Cyphellophora attinorum TaxID=1664694 RepID=A0A0N1NW75_9EURO|nr:TBC domain-containing protein C4G8.04 [Phialophora attinorum]KPI36040.1 TBC domain-containing protein C4G8.04 [Phialophora attinorum]